MRLSIKWVITLGSIFLIWSTHLILTPSTYLASQRIFTTHVRDIMQNIVDLTLEQSNNHLNKAKSAAYLAKQLLSANVIRSDHQGAATLERYFFDQLSVHPHLSGIYYATPRGEFFFVSRNNDKIKDGFRTKTIRIDTNGKRHVHLVWRDANYTVLEEKDTPDDSYDPRKRPWFIESLKNLDVIWTEPYIFYSSQKPGITIAGPSISPSGAIKGVVGVDIEIAELSTFISKLRVGKTGQAFMLNRNGDVIAYRGLDKLIIRKKGSSAFRLPKVSEIHNDIVKKAYESIDWQYDEDGFLRLSGPIYTTFSLGEKKYAGMFAPFPDHRLPWIVGVYIPEEDYLGAIQHNQRVNIIATVVISLLASILGLILAKNIIRPITSLAREAKAIEEDDMESDFLTPSVFHELQTTAETFSRMKRALISYRDTLNEKEEIHQAIVNTANDAIIIMDNDFKVSFWNPAAQRMFGYTADEIMGRDLHQVLAPSSYYPEYSKALPLFRKSGEGKLVGRTLEVTARTREGDEFPVEISMSRLQIKGKWHALAIMRDISERVNAENIKRRLAHDLHDGIGGNLTNIKLLAEMLQMRVGDEKIRQSLHAIADISNDCISEARNYMGALDSKALEWQSLIDELRQYCGRVTESRGITLRVEAEISDHAPAPRTFQYMSLFRIIKEAVNNAIKHARADTITIHCRIDAREFRCEVADNGTGLSPSAGSGRGLLSMETRAVELGGRFELAGERGVTVTVVVPLNKGGETPRDAAEVKENA